MNAVFNVFKSLFRIFFSTFKYVLLFLLICLAVFGISCLCFLFYYCVIKKMPIPKRTKKQPTMHYQHPRPAFVRLFFDFPKRVVLDKLQRNPDAFDTFGVHVFCGEQGSGKSIAAMHFAKCIKERNPLCKVASNIDLNYQDDKINDWTDIMRNNNDELGQIIIIDELQNWFNSMESRNFPPEMLTEITQQRKQRKCIVGTSQVFTRISKPIREQITLLYKPFTICGALTFVRVYKASIDDEGTVTKMSLRNFYFFVHDEELRNCYDTYEKVQRLSKSGFLPRSEQYSNDNTKTINVKAV